MLIIENLNPIFVVNALEKELHISKRQTISFGLNNQKGVSF